MGWARSAARSGSPLATTRTRWPRPAASARGAGASCGNARGKSRASPPCPMIEAASALDDRGRSLDRRDRFLERFAVVAVLLDQVSHLVVGQPVLLGEIVHFAGIAGRNPAAVALGVGHGRSPSIGP